MLLLLPLLPFDNNPPLPRDLSSNMLSFLLRLSFLFTHIWICELGEAEAAITCVQVLEPLFCIWWRLIPPPSSSEKPEVVKPLKFLRDLSYNFTGNLPMSPSSLSRISTLLSSLFLHSLASKKGKR
ncbi:hypothetical protein L1987_18858 [Smallanthus sonchifolius]|uniref:Uncharacterized protein n=1 Tax=Smallanthus sonchifolius TaxID=185202 RepID=A0ACB9J1X3_9ASTR|nr:hypothetical protein L1987_18858 [Smallanthus sonchifolius]